ncbi:MAG: Lrp/AsnC family transcriptional regulator [Rubrivivax sp.]|jgi:Lrp/AsnC family leucine-responsive transcriptional regulator|nr:Lrp/AsnC family transcriptional regulator [Rubrivivax sp.]
MAEAFNSEIDAADTRILAELQSDARLTMAELGRRVHLSQPAVTERVRKLEAAGVITGYRATVNLGALGYGIRAMVRVGRADYDRVVRLIEQTPEVVCAHNVTGEDSWLMEIAVIDVAHLDTVVSRFCIVTETSTAIILKSPREHQPMMPARRPAEERSAATKPSSAGVRQTVKSKETL